MLNRVTTWRVFRAVLRRFAEVFFVTRVESDRQAYIRSSIHARSPAGAQMVRMGQEMNNSSPRKKVSFSAESE